MSDRACYIQRTDRGARIVRARLIGERADEAWHAGGSIDPDAIAGEARHAAEWLRDRLAETRSPKRLATVCLDVDGAACSWVKGRDASADLIRAAVEGLGLPGESAEDDALAAATAPGVADRLPRLPLEVSYGVLDHEPETAGRVAVVAAPDAPARLMLDRLDALGVRVERVVTLWHALAEAWDPGARAGGADGSRVVATDHPPAAVVAIDHAGARLVWAWSRAGVLQACGSMRLRTARAPALPGATGDAPAEVHEHDVARLAADWLGWSAQTGLCPARVVVVGRPGDAGMSPREIGAALTRAWPGALTDLIACDDAVAETLRRTLDARHLNAFAPLSERPTRAHRGAYRAAAGALLAGAACLVVLAVLLFGRAGDTRERIAQTRRERAAALERVDPSLVLDPMPLGVLDTRIASVERRTGGLRVESPRPILNELETISLVVAMPGVTLEEIGLTDTIVTVKTRVPNVRAAEEIDQALRRVGGSRLRWNDPRISAGQGDRINAVYHASWQARGTP